MRIVRMLPVLLAGMLLLSPFGAAWAQTVLRFAQLVPPTHPYHTGILVPWIAEVERATQGRVKIEITTAPMGPMGRNFDLAEQGIADITGGNHAFYLSIPPGLFPTVISKIDQHGLAASTEGWRRVVVEKPSLEVVYEAV